MYWPYVIISYLSLLAVGFLDNLRGPFFLNILNDLSLSNTQGSTFFTVPSLIAFLIGLKVPQIISKIKILNVLRLGLVFMFIGFFVFSRVESLYEIIFGGILYGLGFGVVSSTINIGVNQGTTAKYRRMIFSGLHSNYALASLMAPVVVNMFVANAFNWRITYAYMCFVPLVIVALSFFFKHKPNENLGENKVKIGKAGYLMSMVLCTYLWMEIGLASRFVLFTQTVHGYELTLANTQLMYFFLLLLVGRLLFAFIRMNISNYKIILVSNLISAVLIYLGINKDPIFIVFTGLSFSVVFPALMDFISNNFGARANAVLSFSVALGSLGVVVLHFLIGLFSDLYGIQSALMICCFTAALASIVLIILVRRSTT